MSDVSNGRHTDTRYLTDQVVAYAERLTGLFGSPLDQAISACTGSEADKSQAGFGRTWARPTRCSRRPRPAA